MLIFYSKNGAFLWRWPSWLRLSVAPSRSFGLAAASRAILLDCTCSGVQLRTQDEQSSCSSPTIKKPPIGDFSLWRWPELNRRPMSSSQTLYVRSFWTDVRNNGASRILFRICKAFFTERVSNITPGDPYETSGPMDVMPRRRTPELLFCWQF